MPPQGEPVPSVSKSSSSFILDQAAWPINIKHNRQKTDRNTRIFTKKCDTHKTRMIGQARDQSGRSSPLPALVDLFKRSTFPPTVRVLFRLSMIFAARRVCIARTVPYVAICPSVCLSDCLSVCHTPVLCLNGCTYTHSFFTIG